MVSWISWLHESRSVAIEHGFTTVRGACFNYLNMRSLYNHVWSIVTIYIYRPGTLNSLNGCLVKQPFPMDRFGIIQLKQLFKNGCLGYQGDIYIYETLQDLFRNVQRHWTLWLDMQGVCFFHEMSRWGTRTSGQRASWTGWWRPATPQVFKVGNRNHKWIIASYESTTE